jgi:tape measure domain-containing protein
MEANVGDIVGHLKVETADWQRGLNDAARQTQEFGKKVEQTQQQLSQLPFNAIQNAIDQFSRATQNAGNNQDRLRQAITQAQQQLAQFNVTIDASGRMTDRFGQVLSSGTAEAIRQFRTGIREAQAELAQFQRFGINAPAPGGGGGLFQHMLGVAGGIGIATTIQGITRSLSDFVTTSVTTAASMENLARSFAAVQGSGAAANQTLTALFATSQRAGIGFQDAAEGFRRLQAGAANTVLTTADLLKGFDNISRGAAVMGLSTTQVSSAIVAFEQMLTKGRLSAEELVRQLGNAVPGGLARTAAGLGITTERLRQMAEAGVIPSTIAFTAFQAEMGKMADAVGRIDGLTAGFNRLKNEMTAWMTSIGGWIGDKILPLVKHITALSAAIRELFGIQAPGVTAPPAGAATTPGTAALPIAPSAFTALIQQEARRQSVDPGLLSQLVRAESRFDPEATSRAGARGLGQLMLGTAQGLEMGVTAENIAEPERNLRLAAKYLAEMLERFRGLPDQVKLALAAYNAGPGTVDAVLRTARLAGTPTTYEAIAPRLPRETQTYVQQVLNPPGGLPGTAPVAETTTAALTTATDLTKTWRAELELALKQFGEISRQVTALSTSGMNFNGILSEGINRQAANLVERLGVISNFFAAFPDEAKQMSEELRQQSAEAFRQAAIWKESLLTETQRRDLMRQQVEGMEQVISRQKAQLISQREGQEQAEQFARLDEARLRAARIDDRTARAGMTLSQQIERDTSRLQALQSEAAQLGSQLESRRVEAMRPQLESELQRIQALIGRPGESFAQQASDAVLTQFATAKARLEELIRETARHPALQALQEAFQHAFQALPDAAQQQSALAFEAVQRQARDTLRGIEDQLDQASARTGAAGLSPLDADLARIAREAARATDQLDAMAAALAKLRGGATPEVQQTIDALLGRVGAVRAQQPAAEARDLIERREREGRQVVTAMGNRLEQLQETPGQQGGFPMAESRETLRLRQAAATKGLTQDQQEQVTALRAQLLAQERLNYAIGLYEDFAGSVGNAWGQALMSIADHTKTVAEAFRAMGQSILQTLAQMASQEAWKMLISMGARMLGGIFAPSIPAVGGAAGMGAPAGTGFLSGGGGGMAAILSGAAASGGAVPFQHGGVVRAPTMAMLGENPANNPEVVLNRHQLQSLVGQTSAQQAPQVTIMNYPSKEAAETSAAQERAAGRQVILNEVLGDLRKGSGSSIGRMLRMSQT